jgi:hypothetical protein
LWNHHPEPSGSRRATPLLLFQHRAGQFLGSVRSERRSPAKFPSLSIEIARTTRA